MASPIRWPIVARTVGALSALMLCAWSASAQIVSGRVVDGNGNPVVGVIVIGIANNGSDTVRTQSRERGVFRLRFNVVRGTAHLRFLRLGFVPFDAPMVALDTSVVQLPVVRLSDVPVSLPGLTVHASSSCRAVGGVGDLTSVIWGEVEKALLAEEISREALVAEAEWLEYRRVVDVHPVTGQRRERERSLRVLSEATQRVFRNQSGDDIASRGYLLTSGDSAQFVAPDPEILRSAAFRGSHCFRVRQHRVSDDSIGVDFEPVRIRDGIVDISGTAWLSRSPVRLARVEFRYEGLESRVDPSDRGGVVSFGTLDSGHWIVTGWNARFPLLSRRAARTLRVRGTAGLSSSAEVYVSGVSEAGGLLRSLDQPSGIGPAGVAGRTVVQLRNADTLWMRDAAIALTEGDLEVPIGADGKADLGILPPGTWGIRFVSPALAAAGLTLPSREIVVSEHGPANLEWSVPRLADLVGACGAVGDDSYNGVLEGEVVASPGTPLRDVRIRVVYTRTDARGLRAAVIGVRSDSVYLSPDARGRWRACGLPRGGSVVAKAQLGAAEWARPVRIDSDRLITRVQIEVSPAPVRAQELPLLSTVDSTTDRARGPDGRGTTINREAIVKRAPSATWQLLTGVRGIQVNSSGEGVFALSSRTSIDSPQGGTGCPVTVVVNGVRLPSRSAAGTDLRELPPPTAVERIVVYAGGASVPPALAALNRGSQCGLITIETRRN